MDLIGGQSVKRCVELAKNCFRLLDRRYRFPYRTKRKSGGRRGLDTRLDHILTPLKVGERLRAIGTVAGLFKV
jgi:hypothetical protein